MKSELMVTIRCAAYNHERYIRQCLEGFVMQKTNFRFEAIVHDDASTDGTAKIIKEYADKYPDIIKPIFETENQYRKNNLTAVMNSHMHGKYIAMCEGDDYWIDPLKLQKQVDFLEKHSDYGLVCSELNTYNQQTKSYCYNFFQKKRWNIKYTFDDFLIKAWFTGPCTWVYRKEFLHNDISTNKFIVGDLPLLLEISYKSKIKFLDEATATYRIIPKSASHGFGYQQQINYQKNILKIQLYYLKKYKRLDLKKKILTHWLLLIAKISYNYREYRKMSYYLYKLTTEILCLGTKDIYNYLK